MKFSENLHYLRKRDKITQEELADRLGVSRQSVSKWETGEAYPETDKLLILCDLFDVSLDGLMRGDLTGGEEKEPTVKNGKEYAERTDKFARGIAAGVFLILLGVAVCVVLAGVSLTFEENISNLVSVMGGVAVVLFVAAAVFLFIINGMTYDRFRKENVVTESVYGKEETKAFFKRFAATMACLVSGILLDVIFLVVFISLIDAEFIAVSNKDEIYCYIVAAFLFVISFLVGGLVFTGIEHSKYDINEYNAVSSDKSSPRGKLKDAVCGAIMMTAVALFLVLGFVWNLWHPGWVVFPVGGIICGIVSTIMDIKKD